MLVGHSLPKAPSAGLEPAIYRLGGRAQKHRITARNDVSPYWVARSAALADSRCRDLPGFNSGKTAPNSGSNGGSLLVRARPTVGVASSRCGCLRQRAERVVRQSTGAASYAQDRLFTPRPNQSPCSYSTSPCPTSSTTEEAGPAALPDSLSL